MLREIFEKIAAETESFLLLNGVSAQVKIGDPVAHPPAESTTIYIAMKEYGIDPVIRNHLPHLEESGFSSSNYAHLISFYVIPDTNRYEIKLQLVETVVALFEERPFFQLQINQQDYELSISMKPASSTEYQQFWIARQQPSQPVIFYQARVSSI